MIFSPHDSPFILVFTADARFVGGSHPSCCVLFYVLFLLCFCIFSAAVCVLIINK